MYLLFSFRDREISLSSLSIEEKFIYIVLYRYKVIKFVSLDKILFSLIAKLEVTCEQN